MPEHIEIRRGYICGNPRHETLELCGNRTVEFTYDSLARNPAMIKIRRVEIPGDLMPHCELYLKFEEFDRFVDDLVAFRDMVFDVSMHESRINEAVAKLRK